MMRTGTRLIRSHTSHLPQAQHEIAPISTQLSSLMATFRSQVPPLGTTKKEIEDNFVIQRFIEEACSYTEMAYDEITSNMSANNKSDNELFELDSSVDHGDIDHTPAPSKIQDSLKLDNRPAAQRGLFHTFTSLYGLRNTAYHRIRDPSRAVTHTKTKIGNQLTKSEHKQYSN